MDPPAIAGVRPTMHMTVVGQAVDDRGEGAGSDEHALGQFAGHQLPAGVGEMPWHDGRAEAEPEMVCYGLTESLSGQQKGAQLADAAFGIDSKPGSSCHDETPIG